MPNVCRELRTVSGRVVGVQPSGACLLSDLSADWDTDGCCGLGELGKAVQFEAVQFA